MAWPPASPVPTSLAASSVRKATIAFTSTGISVSP